VPQFGSGIHMEWIIIDGGRRSTIDHTSECDINSNATVGVIARFFRPRCPRRTRILI
jgi:hypothetical protein